jgi:16S rRNA (guanine527-N7)-methyltransferase
MSTADLRIRSARLASALGHPLDGEQLDALVRYERFLVEEASAAGGIGPAEADRIFDRHIGDGLAFLAGMTQAPGSVVDVGSGVGLPGIPLAIALPGATVTLVERSARRAQLLRRVVRMLGLVDVAVLEGDISGVAGPFDVVVFRASLTLGPATAEFLRLGSDPNGLGLFGLSRLEDPPNTPEPPPGVGYAVHGDDFGVLDSPSWLLRMRRTARK